MPAPTLSDRSASVMDTRRVVMSVLGSALAEGLVRRRPLVTRFAARRDLDGRAIAILQDIRLKYGPAPLRLRIPGRNVLMVLNPVDVDEVLTRTPDPFTAATKEKKAALRHFQPRGVLVSEGADRERRRGINEQVLESDRHDHHDAGTFRELIERDAAPLARHLAAGRTLGWEMFATAWWRVVRQIVFGPAGRDDCALTDHLHILRSDANSAYLRPRRSGRRRQFEAAVERYGADPHPGSLLGHPAGPALDQVPHWLFAYDAAGASVFRVLALAATHPSVEQRMSDPDYARASLLDTIRLFPTTLAILRDAVRPVTLSGVEVPAGASIIIHSGFFHRDPLYLPQAHRFDPGWWLDGSADRQPGIVPFSRGPAACPGRNLVELTGAQMITVLARQPLRLTAWTGRRPDPAQPLPVALDNFSLRFSRRD